MITDDLFLAKAATKAAKWQIPTVTELSLIWSCLPRQ
jgi:hypothetical protein